ncbi:MAG TPA: NUDIX hydrolase [Gaiellaceae bacterium]|nr:NUDIX hydrolase [Gaiellaceae bacterium]
MGALDGWRFCARCGRELRAEEDHLRCASCGERYWANPLPAVQALLERDGRVLLARRGIEPRLGHWDLPGGFVEETESPEHAVRRELQEETGLELETADLVRIDIEPYGDRFVFSVTYRVTASGDPAPADDVVELRWFEPADLPAEMAFPGQEKVLREWASA